MNLCTQYARRLVSLGFAGMWKYSNKDILTKSILKDNPTPTEANIEGNLPLWLSGELLRTGPAIFEVGRDKVRHFFDGYAMLLRFTIKEGNVQYQSRFLDSDSYTEAFKQNRIVCSEFGTVSYPDPCKNIFHRFMSRFTVREMSDNGNVNIVPIADEVYASSETHNLSKIDLATLKSKEKVNLYSRNNIAVHTQTAHPHVEDDGTVYNLGTAFSGRSCYKIVRFDPKEGSEPSASVLSTISGSQRNPSYYHSFGMTQNYIVFLEFPLMIDVLTMALARFNGKSFFDAMKFDQSKPTFIHVLDKKTGQTVIKHTTDAMFCFHHINAYEKDGHIVVDLVHYKDNKAMTSFLLENLRNEGISNLHGMARRFVLPLKVEEGAQPNTELKLPTGTSCRAVLKSDGSVHCHSELLVDVGIELPGINYKGYNGKPYRYAYGVGAGFKELVKLDVEEKAYVSWSEEGCFPAEPVFVPKPGATDEDDGVVLSTVLDVRDGKLPYLLILDGKTFKEICRAVVPAEKWCFSLHGIFLSKF